MFVWRKEMLRSEIWAAGGGGGGGGGSIRQWPGGVRRGERAGEHVWLSPHHSLYACLPSSSAENNRWKAWLVWSEIFLSCLLPPLPSPSFPPEDQPIWPPSWPAALLASLNTCIENNKAREQNISQLTGRRSVFVVEAWNFIWSSHLVTPDLSYLLSLSLSLSPLRLRSAIDGSSSVGSSWSRGVTWLLNQQGQLLIII